MRFYADVYLTIEADDTDTARAVLDDVRAAAEGFGALAGSTDVTTDDTDLYETRREIEGTTDQVLDARTGEPAVGLDE